MGVRCVCALPVRLDHVALFSYNKPDNGGSSNLKVFKRSRRDSWRCWQKAGRYAPVVNVGLQEQERMFLETF